MRPPRLAIDFLKHELTVEQHGPFLVHTLKQPDTVINMFRFINGYGVMAVTGDYGNWIFDREFHPSAKGGVDDHYWIGKLKRSSVQNPKHFDSEETEKLIRERIDEKELDGDDFKTLEYLKDLLNHVDDGEPFYMVYAYENLPAHRDSEYIPVGYVTDAQLNGVFDAFDEICRRLKLQEQPETAAQAVS